MCHFDSQTEAQELWVLALQYVLPLMHSFKIKQHSKNGKETLFPPKSMFVLSFWVWPCNATQGQN